MPAQQRGTTRFQRRAGGAHHAPLGRGALGVAEMQRARMLNSAVKVVLEQGYGQMSVSRVTGGAGVSRRTFYEAFESREACFLAAFDQAVADMRTLAVAAWEGESAWSKQLRAALAALLGHLDEQPGIGSLVIVEALGAGPRVLARRAELICEMALAIDLGRSRMGKRRAPSPLAAEGLVGAVLSVVHSRLLMRPRMPLIELLNPLMAMVVAPYLGAGAAARELEQPAPVRVSGAPTATLAPENPFHGLKMRVTHRTLQVLGAIGEHPGASNRQVADRAGITDQGQISKLLARLQGLGLIENTLPAQLSGEPNRWQLTAHGQQLRGALFTPSSSGRASSPGRETV